MRRILGELVLLALLAVAAALAANLLRANRFSLRLPKGFYEVSSGARPVLLPRARALFEAGETVFIDARSAASYEEGQIQGAFSVPFDRWREIYPSLSPWIENQPILIYASGSEVSAADDLAGALIGKGHHAPVFVLIGGVEEWREAGLPVRTGPDSVLSMPVDEAWPEVEW